MTDRNRIAAYVHAPLSDIDAIIDDNEPGYAHIKALASMLADVRREERDACVAICQSAMSKHWTPEYSDGLDGLDRVDYYDAACRRIEAAIKARGAK